MTLSADWNLLRGGSLGKKASESLDLQTENH